MDRMYRKVADSKRGEYKFQTANLIFLGVKKNTKGNPVFMFKYPDGNQFSIFAQNDYNYTHGNADKFIQGEVGEYEHFANLDEMEQFFVNFIKKHGSKSQIDKLEVEESMPSRFSDSRRVKDDEDYVEEPDTLVMYEGEEISYDMKCYDGYAIGKCNEDGADIPKTIKMTYPKISELSEDEIEEILIYRGLKGSVKPEDITYGDVMMAMGELESEYVGVSDSCKRVKDEVDLNNPDANEWIVVSVIFPFNDQLFKDNYEDELYRNELQYEDEYDYQRLDWALLNQMFKVCEDELLKGVASFFGLKDRGGYYHDDYDLIIEMRGAANEFREGIAKLLQYADDVEIRYNDVWIMSNTDSWAWNLFGQNLDNALKSKFGDDVHTDCIIGAIVGTYCMEFDCLYNNVPYLQDLVNEDDVREIIR